MNRMVLAAGGLAALACACASRNAQAPWSTQHWKDLPDDKLGNETQSCAQQKAWCYGTPTADDTGPTAYDSLSLHADTSTIVCIDATGRHGFNDSIDRRESNTTSKYDTVIAPNHSLDVRIVRAPADKDRIAVTMAGSIGETTLETSGVSAAEVKAAAAGDIRNLASLDVPGDGTKCGVYEQRFAPRVPGIATVSVTFTPKRDDEPKPNETDSKIITQTETTTKAADGTVKSESVQATKQEHSTTSATGAVPKTDSPSQSSYNFELLVPRLYSGAIRVGLSAIAGIGDHEYTAVKAPGADTAHVVDNGGTMMSNDLVLGYSAFFETVTSQRGRDYARNYRLFHAPLQHLGAYLGLGVASAAPATNGTKVEWLRSFMVGVEYELFQNFSIALVGSARRVDQLAPDLAIGGPIADMTPVTETRIRYGIGVVISFSPEFLKFASTVGVGK